MTKTSEDNESAKPVAVAPLSDGLGGPMTREELLARISETRREVASWPRWMREAIAHAPRWMAVNGADD